MRGEEGERGKGGEVRRTKERGGEEEGEETGGEEEGRYSVITTTYLGHIYESFTLRLLSPRGHRLHATSLTFCDREIERQIDIILHTTFSILKKIFFLNLSVQPAKDYPS
jgi:hypothetical protein